MFIRQFLTQVSLSLGFAITFIYPALSQITPNGAGTIVNPQGNQINITGGTQAGANLFHSFRDFNVNSAQVANFLSNPQIQNILARVNGGNPSLINGLLQVTGGNSNLFLMNPAGIVFGQGASLNVPASFTATTANQIGFGNNLFNAFGDNNFSALIGNPDSFLFTTTQAGSIVNAGNLAVGNGQNLSLIAGNTINTGRLTAPGGEIQVVAVPGTNRVRLSQMGQVLSLEIVPPVDGTLRAVDLPTLLTGSDLPGIQVNPSGQIQVGGTTLPNQQGLAVASGTIDASSTSGNGGVVQVMGDRVAVLNSRINANGATGGGTVRLGGEYLGGRDTGIAPALRFNSQRTLVDRNSLIRANATVTGEGGRVIVWADQNTGYFGRITGRGATGRGGFVEVSGRENLAFDGRVELQGFNGLDGSLLLDPLNVVIGASGIDNGQITGDGIIGAGEAPGATWFITPAALNGIASGTTINIAASGNIDFQANVNLTGGAGAAPVFINAATITSLIGPPLTFNTNGRPITIVADSVNAQNFNVRSVGPPTFSGNITITANNGDISLNSIETVNNVNAGSLTLNAPQGNISVTGSIHSASSGTGNGGPINLTALGNITAPWISSVGSGVGNSSGTININAGNLLRVTGTAIAPCPGGNSICSIGQSTAGNGAITIRHGGGTTTPFIVGNSATNGTLGAINAGAGSTINTTLSIPVTATGTYTQGTIQIITPVSPVVVPTVADTPLTSVVSLFQNPEPPPTPPPVIVGTPPEPSPVVEEIPVPIPSPIIPLPLPSPSPSPEVIPVVTISPIPTPSIIDSTPNPTPSISPALPTSLRTFFTDVNLNPPNLLQILPPTTDTIALITNPSDIDISARIGGLEAAFQNDVQQYLGITPTTSNGSASNSANSNQTSNPNQTSNSGTLDRPSNSVSPNQPSISGNPDQQVEATNLSQQASAQYSLQETQLKLNRITETTRVKPALIYVFFAPQDRSNNFNSANLAAQTNRAASDEDSLEVILITGKAKPVRIQLPNLTRRQVLAVANNFRSEVTNSRSPRGFLNPAQQIYKWFLAPLEEELQKQGIDNLVFLMDTGLRSIPLAAMHDDKEFIVERYSVGLMPSLNLTEPTYNSLDGSQVLAMGATTFDNSGLNPLPAVSLELNTVSQLWQGSEFLNDRFTLSNLIQQRQDRPFRMIHLATHAVFSPGDRSNSFIQLWDQKLSLDQLSQLNWGNPPVDLLVLSACQTALGDRDAELGFASLAINAGVRTALASLWEVNDAATLGLMTKFYQQLQVTTTKAEALRQAQLAMLRGDVRLENGNLVTPDGMIPLTEELKSLGNLRLTHPYFWSAFTLVGNPW